MEGFVFVAVFFVGCVFLSNIVITTETPFDQYSSKTATRTAERCAEALREHDALREQKAPGAGGDLGAHSQLLVRMALPVSSPVKPQNRFLTTHNNKYRLLTHKCS